MTKENIINQLSSYRDLIDIEDSINKIEDLIYDYEIELGNIICMFVYKQEDGLELSFLTCPCKNMNKLKIKYKK